MDQESTKPTTEMSTGNHSGRPERKSDNLTAICERII
jgi:hypothetical protein